MRAGAPLSEGIEPVALADAVALPRDGASVRDWLSATVGLAEAEADSDSDADAESVAEAESVAVIEPRTLLRFSLAAAVG